MAEMMGWRTPQKSWGIFRPDTNLQTLHSPALSPTPSNSLICKLNPPCICAGNSWPRGLVDNGNVTDKIGFALCTD